MNQPRVKRDLSGAKLAFLSVEQSHVLASWREVGIAVWIEDVSVAAIQAAEFVLETLARQRPEGIAFLQVIGEESGSFDAPVRQVLRDLLRAGRSYLREAPVVYEGSGFRAAAVRAIVTGILSQRSYGFPHRVYSRVEDAALAVGRKFELREPTRYARELCEALADVRDRHERDFPSGKRSFIRYRS